MTRPLSVTLDDPAPLHDAARAIATRFEGHHRVAYLVLYDTGDVGWEGDLTDVRTARNSRYARHGPDYAVAACCVALAKLTKKRDRRAFVEGPLVYDFWDEAVEAFALAGWTLDRPP